MGKISQETRTNLRRRAGGQCECEMKVCGHRDRCIRGLSYGHWEAHLRWTRSLRQRSGDLKVENPARDYASALSP